MLARLLWLMIILAALEAAFLTVASPASAMEYAVRDDTVFASGPMVPADPARLRWLLDGGHVQRLVIDSPGGLVDSGLALAELVHDHYLTVEVRRDCASMCSLLFVAAARRRVTREATIRVHSAVSPDGETEGATFDTVLMARRMAAFATPPAIIGRMVMTPPLPHPLATLTPAELDTLHVEWLD